MLSFLMTCLEGWLSFGKGRPGGSLDGRISLFMLAAIEPEIPVADGGVHKSAVMGGGLARMGVRPEMAAADAQALDRNGPCLLQRPDDLDLRPQ